MLRFQGPKTLAAWLRSALGYDIRMNLVAEEALAQPRVLIVTEGNCVSVYVDGSVSVKHVDRPLCQTPAGNDRADELLISASDFDRMRYRMTFWTSGRSLSQRVFDAAVCEVPRPACNKGQQR